jgi:hypothetical protein
MRSLRVQLAKVQQRNCPKSLGSARGVALRSAVKALFDAFRPPHNVRIHLRSLVRTPFRTVSEGEFCEVRIDGVLRSSQSPSLMLSDVLMYKTGC